MKRIFADSSGLVALGYADDQYHHEAVELASEIKKQRLEVVISDHILAETVTIIRKRAGFEYALRLGNELFNSKITTLIIANEKILNNAWAIFSKYSDKDFSFVDCISFAIMEQSGIDTAFTFDSHFKQIGFKVLK